ncbi:hypothetical protein G647_05917, partial [Cladophialophora carrionii CBS 160.54]
STCGFRPPGQITHPFLVAKRRPARADAYQQELKAVPRDPKRPADPLSSHRPWFTLQYAKLYTAYVNMFLD